MEQISIRPDCLKAATDGWVQPTGHEIREVLKLAGLTGGAAGRFLGLGKGGDRTVRRWVGEETNIPFSAWALLCDLAGLGQIWISK
jgi:hypothetical protein